MVVVYREMASAENLATIRAAGYHWLVSAAQPERGSYFDQCQEQAGWQEIIREPSRRNEGQRKVRLLVKLSRRRVRMAPRVSVALCWSQCPKVGLTSNGSHELARRKNA